MSKNQPEIWILTPTFNAESVLERYFQGVEQTTYPKDKLHIIMPDGGSTDQTVAIAQAHQATILDNRLKTGEAGKAVGVHYILAQTKAPLAETLVCLLDSDNFITQPDWFERLIEPLSDPEVIGSEPWEYLLRPTDPYITRYGALIGGADPVMLWLGHYDRLNTLSGKWTELPLRTTDHQTYLTWSVDPYQLPTIGANGTIFRASIFAELKIKDYLFDVDVLYQYAEKHQVKFAKVKIGIVHLISTSLAGFIRKQKRRIQDYQYFEAQGLRAHLKSNLNYQGLLLFILSCLTILPLFWQVLKGYTKRPDSAWWFHPVACWVTLWIYGTGRLLGKLKKPALADRSRWVQG